MAPPSNINDCATAIALEFSIDRTVVKKILERYHFHMFKCLLAEIPFTLYGIGKLYHIYARGKLVEPNSFWTGKVLKTLRFTINADAKAKLQGWVHDLGMKSSLPAEMMKLSFKPEDIEKIRKVKMLEEQKKAGLTPDLLFDENEGKVYDALTNNLPDVKEVQKRIRYIIDNE